MKYRLEDVPRYQNGSVRPRLAEGIFPQARGVHFVFGKYDEMRKGVPVVLFDGRKRRGGVFIEDRFKTMMAGDMTRADYMLNALLAAYAAQQEQSDG